MFLSVEEVGEAAVAAEAEDAVGVSAGGVSGCGWLSRALKVERDSIKLSRVRRKWAASLISLVKMSAGLILPEI